MPPEGGDTSERTQGHPEAISRPPDPGAVAIPSPDLRPHPAYNYLSTSDPKFLAPGRRMGPRGPKRHLEGVARVSTPWAALRPFRGPPTREQSKTPPPTYAHISQTTT